MDQDLRRAIADIVVALHDNPWQGELMDDRWPHNLEGCRKLRFDKPGWKGKPRYRFVYRNEPSGGSVASMLVLAVGRRDNMIAYAQASGRLTKHEAAKRSPRFHEALGRNLPGNLLHIQPPVAAVFALAAPWTLEVDQTRSTTPSGTRSTA